MAKAKGLEIDVSIVDDEIVAARKECLKYVLSGVLAIAGIGASKINGEMRLTEEEESSLSAFKPLSSKLPIFDGVSIQSLITTITECLIDDHLDVNIDDNGLITGCHWHSETALEISDNAR